jgi:rSAM/selenodomain-associated transferase 2
MPSLSVIIPTYNEEQTLNKTVQNLLKTAKTPSELEIIVADGGSNDKTQEIAENLPVRFHSCDRKGRAAQMNEGADLASANILYFLHSDTLTPQLWDDHILNTWKKGHRAGCFQLKFSDDHPVLRFYSWFTRFQKRAFRYGDQSVFVSREFFRKSGGYLEDHIVMEDNEFIWRAFQEIGFVIMNEAVITSARRYRENGIFRLQAVFLLIYLGYFMGYSQEQLVALHKKMLRG